MLFYSYIIFLFILCISNYSLHAQIADSIFLSSSYSNQSFYSLSNGEVLNTDNTNWDLAFSIVPMNSCIRINGGKNVELYSYHLGDTSSWNSINQNIINSLNQPLYNSDTSWSLGAFDLYQTSPFDMGWGVYNIITHHVTGDSLYIMKTINGNWKKLWIQSLAGGVYNFKYANLDGTSQINQVIDKNNYSDKNFIYYSLDNNMIEDREPINTGWDITFTKYIALDMPMPYSVTGVLANAGIQVAKATQVSSPLTYNNYNAHTFMTEMNTIGYDWKYYDMSLGYYVLSNDLCYFVRDNAGGIYRLVFLGFEGMSTGKIVFNVESLSLTNSTDVLSNHSISIFPNPTLNITNIVVDTKEEGELIVFDISGKQIYQKYFDAGFNAYTFSAASFGKGIYIINTMIGEVNNQKKLVVY